MRIFTVLAILFLGNPVYGQLRIEKPVSINYIDRIDSITLNASVFCIGSSILQSQYPVDVRMVRWQAFGDQKLIRIYGHKNRLSIDVYKWFYGDSIAVVEFKSELLSKELKGSLLETNLLNLPNFNYEFMVANSLPTVVDGNYYRLESKLGNDFSKQEFDNPEIFAQHYPNQSQQAVKFVEFINTLQKITKVNIIDHYMNIKKTD